MVNRTSYYRTNGFTRVRRNFDYPGNEISSMTGLASACANACGGMQNCLGFTRDKTTGNCSLKSALMNGYAKMGTRTYIRSHLVGLRER